MTSFRRITRTSTALFAAGALAFGVAACDDGDNGDVVDAPAEDDGMTDDGMDDGMDDDGMDDGLDDDMDDDGFDEDGLDDDMDDDA